MTHRIFVDSDILIEYLHQNLKAQAFFKQQKGKGAELWTGAMQRAEIVFFMRPQEEADTLAFLRRLKTAEVDEDLVDMAGKLYRKWNPSHGIDINDAFLAATAINRNGHLYTQNLKHYPMRELTVSRGW